MNRETHIVSLIVQLVPEYKDEIIKKASLIPLSEYYTDSHVHKLVIVFEAESESTLSTWFDDINNWQGVLSTQLCYHHCESNESLQEEIQYANNPA